MTIDNYTKEKQTVSSRVNKYIFDQYKDSEIPISTVIEASLIYFLKLTDDEKFKFLSENTPQNTSREDLIIPELAWSELISKSLKVMNMSHIGNITTSMAIGIIGGAVSAGLSISKLLRKK